MNKTFPTSMSFEGFTVVELMIVVMILSILITILVASYDTIIAKARYSRTAADMESIAKVGYADYTNNLGIWDVSPNPWTPPPSIMGSGLLQIWPIAPCQGWYFSWDNGAIFGLNDVRVTLRRPDDTPFWSYCVNTFGGGTCNGPDMYAHVATIEITTADTNHFYCTE